MRKFEDLVEMKWTLSDDSGNGGHDDGFGEEEDNILVKTRPKTKKPDLYKVLLLNDEPVLKSNTYDYQIFIII